MKNIKAIIEDYSEQLDEKQREAICKAVEDNYKTVEEWQKKQTRISELEEQNQALSESIGNLEAESEEVQKLRDQVAQFEADEKQRKADEEHQAKRNSFMDVFNAAVGDREFANDIIRDSVFDKVFEQCSNGAGIGAKDALDTITKDADGIWKNPQQDVHMMPEPNALSTGEPKSKSGLQKMANQLFGSIDQ